jgi:hypothetical protein
MNSVIKINVQHKPQLALKLGILGTPAVLTVENYRIDQFILGARSERFLRKLL